MQQYLERRALYPTLIEEKPNKEVALIVTIPCHNEPDVYSTMKSLAACASPECAVEVIICINADEETSEIIQQQNEKTVQKAKHLASEIEQKHLKFHILHFSDLPKKHAGVGLARKIAMDEAVRRFMHTDIQEQGVIVCLDADTLVEESYLTSIHDFFRENTDCQAAGIYYEHPLSGSSAYTKAELGAILSYELHLRYYVHALRWAGLPTATQTVGSAMAVRAHAYCAQGGMNRRKAGEDFYFIHKFTGLGGYREITSTCILPSPRISDRVPFGTGKAVGEIVSGKAFLSYAPLIFKDLRAFLVQATSFYKIEEIELEKCLATLPQPVSAFLEKENFTQKLKEIQGNTTSQVAFEKRFFQWFDAFLAMKYVHFARDMAYPSQPVKDCVNQWIQIRLNELDSFPPVYSEFYLLMLFRAADKREKVIEV